MVEEGVMDLGGTSLRCGWMCFGLFSVDVGQLPFSSGLHDEPEQLHHPALFLSDDAAGGREVAVINPPDHVTPRSSLDRTVASTIPTTTARSFQSVILG